MPLRPPAGFIRIGYNPLRVPDAPTIGTATPANEQISIAFTAPSNTGGGSVTGYIATAKKTSDGTTISATGSSSPIVITGLTNGTAYTVTVAAVNSFGPGPSSETSGSVTPVLVIGDAFGGGYYTGKIVQGGLTYYLIVAPKSSGEDSFKSWKTSATDGPSDTQTLNNGPAASSSMNSATYPAAQFCEGLTIGGYSDWYLPSRDELELCYRNLKPDTTSNSTSARSKSSITYPEGNDVSGDTMGVNRNSDPTGAAYTSSVPGRTAATAFQSGGSEAFDAGVYWTSSEYSSANAWRQLFDTGAQNNAAKNFGAYCRAVRRVAV